MEYKIQNYQNRKYRTIRIENTELTKEVHKEN